HRRIGSYRAIGHLLPGGGAGCRACGRTPFQSSFRGVECGINDFGAVERVRSRQDLAIGSIYRRKAIAEPGLFLIDGPVGADDVMIELGDARWQAMPEPVGRMTLIDPGDWVEQGPNVVGLIFLQNRVDVKADRQAHAAEFGVDYLDATI